MPGAGSGIRIATGQTGKETRHLLHVLPILVAKFGKCLALAGQIPIPAAAWVPCAMLAIVALALWLNRRGRLGEGG